MARAPVTPLESLLANCRPQPAIPALLVLMLTLVFAASQSGPPGQDGIAAWPSWLVAAGIVLSCGLAIAAGFCSLFPPLAWIAVAWFGLGVIGRLPGHAYLRPVLFAGMAAAAAMIAVQVLRVRTGRFAPTIADGHGE
jgi:hypothetical protein